MSQTFAGGNKETILIIMKKNRNGGREWEDYFAKCKCQVNSH